MTGERRKEGIHQVMFDDGNGGQKAGWIVQKHITPWHVIVVTIVAVLGLVVTVGTVAFNATRAGVEDATQDVIRHEMSPRGGIIRQGIDRQITEHEIESERNLNATLEEIKQGQTQIKVMQGEVCRRLSVLEDKVNSQ